MTCLSEFDCSRYADGAMSGAASAEAARVELHIVDCGRCRIRVQQALADVAALRSALVADPVAVPLPAFASPGAPAGSLWLAGLLALGLWAVNALWLSVAQALALPQWFEWVLPDRLGVGIDVVLTLLMRAVGVGTGPLSGALHAAAWLGVAVAGWMLVWWLAERDARRLAMPCLAACALSGLLVAQDGHALEVRHDEHTVTISADETIDDTLIAAAETVVIDGDVSGDVFAFAEDVRVRGHIGGLLVVGSQSVDVEADVDGTVVILAEDASLTGAVFGANVIGAVESFELDREAAVKGNVALAAQRIDAYGNIGRDLLIAARTANVTGRVGRGVQAFAERVSFADTARITGDVKVRTRQVDNVRRDPGAVIGGEWNILEHEPEPSTYLSWEFYLAKLVQFGAAVLAGLLLLTLFPSLRGVRVDGGPQALKAVAVGIVALIATPVIAVLVAVTLIGLPIGLATFMLWLIGLYVAGIVVAMLIGDRLLGTEARGWKWPLVVGLAIVFLAVSVPFIGGALRFAIVALGLGLLLQRTQAWWYGRGVTA